MRAVRLGCLECWKSSCTSRWVREGTNRRQSIRPRSGGLKFSRTKRQRSGRHLRIKSGNACIFWLWVTVTADREVTSIRNDSRFGNETERRKAKRMASVSIAKMRRER
ncbi:hypothetical protein BDZ97DRAFT_1813996 [Flammula alnicola]|nr:hypothetical protein BDZ97DRAFT_1813996 [Flammula alnicola]